MTEAIAEPTAPALDKLAAALAQFQAEMPTVPKAHTANVRSEKGSFAYTYAGLADVTEAAMPLLAKHGLSFTTLPRDGLLVGMLLHTSGQTLTAALPIHGSTPQQIGSSLTYMRRYLLGCMTGLVTDDDDDGQIATQTAAKKASKKTTSQPAGERVRMSRGAQTPPDRPPVAPPLPDSPYLDTQGQLAKAMFAALADIGIVDKADRLAYVSHVIGREIAGSAEMTDADAETVLAAARHVAQEPFVEEPQP